MISGGVLQPTNILGYIATMSCSEDIASLSREDLVSLVAELQRQVMALQDQVTQLAADKQELLVEVDRLTRQSKRQATPFSKGTRSHQPKRPGRKPGQGTFTFRQAPSPEEITEPPVDVPVTLESCPGCGGRLVEERVDFAYITDLPPLPRPKVTQYRVWVCRCTACSRKIRGEHPNLASAQYGATAHRLGPRAMAAAHVLHYQVGIPVRKVPLVLALLTGMELTQGAITQDALRRAKGTVGAAYRQLRSAVRDSPAVYTDDTGWKVGGENAHLMAFDTDQATVYQVRPRHRHQEVQEVIPRNYLGVIVTDRGRSYEAHSFSQVKQQKCLAHLQKTLSTLLEKKKGRARELGENLKMLFGMALDLWDEYHAGAVADFEARAAELRFVISYQLRERTLRDPDNRHLLKALRPAVIARKVSQCSKNEAGAYAFSAFKSVVQTLAKRGAGSIVEAL
ncbi:MAG TPA: transposase, partial [Dehalococcoidia bacterium]|nr:transposase [Dehalococcoidia bacterium]